MDKKIRIAIVISHPIQHFCPQYASFAKDESIDLKVFFASTLGYKKYHDPNFGKEISWNNLQLEVFNHEFLNNNELLPADKNIDAPELNQKLFDFKPDVVIIYGYFQKLQRRAFRWARKNDIPIAYISDSERNRDKKALSEMVKYPFLYRFFSKISFFLTVGDANEAYYRHYGVAVQKFIRMHFPIDIALYEESYQNREVLEKGIRTRFQIGEEEIVLSVVGKLVEWKRQNDIIEAMIQLEKEGVYMHLFVLGSGEMMGKWKERSGQLSRSRVHFMGFVEPEKLPDFYASTDIYIHPASLEPHSLAISEAIYMGCPVILSNKCGSYGPTDDVQVDKNGLVYECGNISELSLKIKLLSIDRELRNRFGEYSHSIANKFQHQAHSLVLKKIRQRAYNGENNKKILF